MFYPCHVQKLKAAWGNVYSCRTKFWLKNRARKNHIFFSLCVKPALKICIQQGQVIVYRNFTTRKGTFLFKESFKACFIRVTSRNSKPPGEMCTAAEQNFDWKAKHAKTIYFFPRRETCPQNLYTTRSSYNLSKFHH